MERELFTAASSELGRISISSEAIAQIVGYAAAESYGVVALAGPGRWSRLFPWGLTKGVRVEKRDDGLAVDLHVVVEHGLNLAEVASAARNRVVYELERQTGMPVASVEVHIDRVRRSR